MKKIMTLLLSIIFIVSNLNLNTANATSTNSVTLKPSKTEFFEGEKITFNITNNYKYDINGFLAIQSPTRSCPKGKVCITDPVNRSLKVKVSLKAKKTTKITTQYSKLNKSGGFLVYVLANGGGKYGKAGIKIIKSLPNGGIKFSTDKKVYNIGETVRVSITNDSPYTVSTLKTAGKNDSCLIPEGCSSIPQITVPIQDDIIIKPKQTINLTYTASSVAVYILKLSYKNYGKEYSLITGYIVMDESQAQNKEMLSIISKLK